MKTKLTRFRRNGIYYSQDSTTSKQKSLGTRDETAARKLVEAKKFARMKSNFLSVKTNLLNQPAKPLRQPERGRRKLKHRTSNGEKDAKGVIIAGQM
jgi:hypothetical protein